MPKHKTRVSENTDQLHHHPLPSRVRLTPAFALPSSGESFDVPPSGQTGCRREGVGEKNEDRRFENRTGVLNQLGNLAVDATPTLPSATV